jgi:hypothetical protein
MDERIEKLERTVRVLGVYAALLTALPILLAVAGFRSAGASDQVLRARGLVIVDEAGRERILLGAPIPEAANRVRTDLDRVREIWGPRFPEQYMDFYREYDHSTNGLLILDEQGFDRVAIGAPVPDPNIGKRIGPSTGMLLNDEQGFERSGYGLLNVNDVYRVVLGLDSAKGREGLALMLDDGGDVGIMVRDDDRSIFLGSERPAEAGSQAGFHGLRLERGDERRHEINVAKDE